MMKLMSLLALLIGTQAFANTIFCDVNGQLINDQGQLVERFNNIYACQQSLATAVNATMYCDVYG